ncbi:protein regulator of cytokinesis hypothetical protein [Limosa lapponica baueri]|uniref:Uncharacterized protein n=1 Tax=Limosa lapponica baueri TaxID=1758121 RepID=A0A2I0T943_LIMLA|nr:protein regulator of cytokinesis hypothetical protein [Limosa lapponica baueri]
MPLGSGCAGADPLLSLPQLEAQRSVNADMCVELRSRITVLWERLQVPAEERELSAVHTIGSSAKIRKARLKKTRQMKEEVMYGSTPQRPLKRRVLSPHVPSKVRKLLGCKSPC